MVTSLALYARLSRALRNTIYLSFIYVAVKIGITLLPRFHAKNLHSTAIAEFPWLPLLGGPSLLVIPIPLLVLLLLVQGGIEVAVLVGLHALRQAAADASGTSCGIGPVDVVAVQLFHGFISNDLGDLG